MQGTTQQLAAVAALHSLNWRFHTALKTWFQWPSSHQVTPRVRRPVKLKASCFVSLGKNLIALTCLALVATQYKAVVVVQPAYPAAKGWGMVFWAPHVAGYQAP